MTEEERLERYKFIRQRLLDTAEKDAIVAEIERHAKRLSDLSSRHHFIPQHYIEGFCGNDKLVAVYDKVEDRISRRRISPKSIFFEPDRHTIDVDGLKLSSLEDFLFKDIDTKMAPYLKTLREDPIEKALLASDNQTNLSVFMIDLFWRNPVTDFIAGDLFQRSAIRWPDGPNGELLQDLDREAAYKSDPLYQKLARFGVMAHSMKHMVENTEKGFTDSKLWETKRPMFILGDFPIVFSKFPETHPEIATLDRFLPISSTRIYAEQAILGLHFEKSDALVINALQILQAKKSVVAADINLLVESVRAYKAMTKDGVISYFKNRLFLSA